MNKLDQVNQDLWKAEFSLLMIRACHCSLESAILCAEAHLESVDYDIDEYTPEDRVEDEIAAMGDSCI